MAKTLMGSPVFFQETKYYSKEARDQIRPLLAVYRQHRDEISEGYVFPVGKKPDNKSWTGFQNVQPQSNSGYLTLFRELHNAETKSRLKLRFLDPGPTLKLTDLLSGRERKLLWTRATRRNSPFRKPLGSYS